VAIRCKQTTPSLWPKPKPDDFPEPRQLSPFVLSGSTADHGPQRGRAGWEIVGRDHLGRGSVQNEAHTGKTASMIGDDGRAIEGPGLPIPAMRGTASLPHSYRFDARGKHHPASAPRCPPEARPPHRYPRCAGKSPPRPDRCGALQEAGPLAKGRKDTGPREARGGGPPRRGRKTTATRLRGPPGALGQWRGGANCGEHAPTGHAAHDSRIREAAEPRRLADITIDGRCLDRSQTGLRDSERR
jgi:hypothetical protein